MSRLILLAGIAALTPISGFGAGEAPSPEAPAGMNARQASVTSLESLIAQRELRLVELGRDIVELDTRIEKRIDGLVKLIAGLPESKEPSGGNQQIRKEAVEALKRGIAAYSAKRREVDDNIRGGDIRAEADLGKFDDRINKRVDQIAELSRSIPTRLENETADYEGAAYWNGYFFETNRLLEEGRRIDKGTKGSAESLEKAVKSVKTGIETIGKRRESLHALLARRKTTESARQLYTRELGKLDANESHLRETLRGLTMAATRDGKPVSLDPAHDLGQLLSDSREDLREDTSRLFRTYDQFTKIRTLVDQLKAELAARRKWLEHDKP